MTDITGFRTELELLQHQERPSARDCPATVRHHVMTGTVSPDPSAPKALLIKPLPPPPPAFPRPIGRHPVCAERSAFTAYRRNEEPDGLPCFPAAPFNPVRALTLGIAASISRTDSGGAAGPAACPPQTLADGRLRIGTGTAMLARRYRHAHRRIWFPCLLQMVWACAH